MDVPRGAKPSCAALRTTRHVLAGEAQEELFPALTNHRPGRLRSDPKEPTAEREALLPDRVGEQSVVSNANEAEREYVQQEAAEERLGGFDRRSAPGSAVEPCGQNALAPPPGTGGRVAR